MLYSMERTTLNNYKDNSPCSKAMPEFYSKKKLSSLANKTAGK